MLVREWGRPDSMARDQRGSRFRDWSQRQFRFAGRGRAVTMGSIDKYIFRTTLASLALIPGSLTGARRIARGLERTLGGIDPMTGRAGMILTFPGFGSGAIRAFVIGRSNVPLLRHMLRVVTA